MGLVLMAIHHYTSQAEPCENCNQIQSKLAQEQKMLASYQELKRKNEAYLQKQGIPAGAVIKVNSNLLVINLKIETAGNNIQLIEDEKKKANCNQCKLGG